MQMKTASCEPFFGLSPVRHVESVLNMGCTEIVMLQIVGVLPHVNIEKKCPGI